MSNSLAFLCDAIEDRLGFDYQGGDDTLIEFPHSTGWRTLSCAVIVQVQGVQVGVSYADGRLQLINDGEAFCIPPGLLHKSDQMSPLAGISRWSHVNFTLSGSTSLFALLDVPAVITGAIAQHIGDLNSELSSLYKTSEVTLSQAFRKKALGYQLAATLVEVSQLKSEPRVQNDILQIAPVLQYIDLHLAAALTREELASLVHLSPTRFYALFKSVVGLPPSDYIQNLRLRKAQQLLLLTPLTVHEIAQQVGYHDLFYFSRLFKKRYGLSPSYYREQMQGF